MTQTASPTVVAYIHHGSVVRLPGGAACEVDHVVRNATQTRTLDRGDVVPLCDACARAHDQAQHLATRAVGEP